MGEIIAPEIFRLQSGGIEAMISTAGAWVEGLRLNTGTETIDLFAPKREFEVDGWKKSRGGMHVCLPNFDPADESLGLAQHGFGRVLTWEITSIDDASVTMVLDTNKHKLDVPSNYLGLVAEVVYSTEDNENGLVVLNSKLTMTNNSGANMPWAVGFHPYFASNGDNESNLVVYSHGHEPQEFDK